MSAIGASLAVTAVVPTLGASPHLAACLRALGGREMGVERIVVAPATADLGAAATLAERVLRTPGRLGFAAATNLGIASALAGGRAPGEVRWIATVNDDAVVEPGWATRLAASLDAEPRAAAAQGVNLRLPDSARVDGWGLAWNRRWQAAQLGAGGPPPPVATPPREVFGASATAAVFRAAALADLVSPHGIFDERLDSFYEDVELAGRLRGAGWTALSVPAARAGHAGSTTAGRRVARRTAWIYGNRFLALADLLGDELPAALTRALRADLVDVFGALAEPRRLAGIFCGWWRALRLGAGWRREGRPRVPLAELRRLEAPSA